MTNVQAYEMGKRAGRKIGFYTGIALAAFGAMLGLVMARLTGG